MSRPRSNKTRNIIIGILLFALVLGVLGLVVFTSRGDNGSQIAEEDTYINLEPATEEDLVANDERKKNLADDESQEPKTDDSSNKIEVETTIVVAQKTGDFIEVRSYVTGIYEAGGICTATFTKGDQKVTKTVEGIKDATYTRCDRVVVKTSELKGTGWSVTMTYSSDKAFGKSDTKEVDYS